MSELIDDPLRMSMSSEPLVYLTYGELDPLVFKAQVARVCEFIWSECGVAVQAVVMQSDSSKKKPVLSKVERSVDNYEAVRVLGSGTRTISVSDGWWNNPASIDSVLAQVLAYSPASIMCDDPRLVPLCTRFKERDIPFFFHAIGCRYMTWAHSKVHTLTWIEEMKKLEMAAFKSADWIYATSEELVTHFKEIAAYRDHNHSFLPMAPLQLEAEPEGDLPTSFLNESSTLFTYAGPINIDVLPRSLLESFAAILKLPHARLLILGEDIEELRVYPFLSQENCLLRKCSFENTQQYASITDYAIILSKKSAQYTYAGSVIASNFLCSGAKLIVSPGLGEISRMTSDNNLGVLYRGRTDNELLNTLTSLTQDERAKVKSQAFELFNWNSDLNRIRFRHLKRLHDGI